MNREIALIASMVAREGAWSLFRLGWPGGTMVSTLGRGETLGYMHRLEAIALQAVYDEANYGRWTAVANVRKAVL